MNILFMSLLDFDSLDERNIYTDLLRQFVKNGHDVTVVSPYERKSGKRERVIKGQGSIIVKIGIGNIQKVRFVEKGISTIMIKSQIIRGIKKFLGQKKFDLVIYPTPPVTLCGAVEHIKERDKATTYLLLKDIFPQNAVDLGMMTKTGLKGLVYQYFRNREKRLYRISDRIGCMSQANVDYVLKHNPEVKRRDVAARKESGKGIVEVCPNCMEPMDISISAEERKAIREKYGIPLDRTVFVYGGNLGKPQGIEFMLKCLHSQRENGKVFFLIVGNGTEYGRVERYVEKYRPENIVLHQWIPKEEYDKAIAACNVGMIFLDHRFTIPNFPSRLLSYMQANLPVLAVTDGATDIGKIIVENAFGWWCKSGDSRSFAGLCGKLPDTASLLHMGERAREYLEEHYLVRQGYEKIMYHMQGRKD